jgi:hypothetical protein
LYKSETPSCEVWGNLCEGKINSQKLKGQLKGKNTKELIKKIEKGEAYVDIMTEDKPSGKVRGKIKKISIFLIDKLFLNIIFFQNNYSISNLLSLKKFRILTWIKFSIPSQPTSLLRLGCYHQDCLTSN